MTKTVVYLQKSEKPAKKYKVYIVSPDEKRGKVIHFGARGMSDFTLHKDPKRMERYSARHKRGGETWTKAGVRTAGFWSKWLLWNKPSIAESKKNISSRFGIVFKSGWPSTQRMSKPKSRRNSKGKSKRKSRRRVKKTSKRRVKKTSKSRVKKASKRRVKKTSKRRVKKTSKRRVKKTSKSRVKRR
jgi:hypothetical protein